jgi:hypothetical protein
VSRIWVRNHHGKGWITAGWTHQGVVGQPFADFTWRESRKIAAQRGVDDTNEMAVAVILAALLRRAETGPSADRVLARSRAARKMSNHLPAELTTPAPAALPAGTSVGDAEEGDQPAESVEIVVAEVVPFGMFDPFADDLGGRR